MFFVPFFLQSVLNAVRRGTIAPPKGLSYFVSELNIIFPQLVVF